MATGPQRSGVIRSSALPCRTMACRYSSQSGYFRSISGEHPDWDEYRQAMVRQGKSLLRITPERWGPVATGGFPPRLAP